jgi:hypothetical protein
MKAIVTTSIFPPTEALKKFAEKEDWTLFVVGDKKTPHEEYLRMNTLTYLTPEYQEQTYPVLSDLTGWNCIQRRNIGYVEALRAGASVIASVDDDNIPLPGWGQHLLLGRQIEANKYTPLSGPVFDPLSATSYKHLWHRGFPIAHLQGKNNRACEVGAVTPDIQADFWNGDPDVDAVCRLVHAPECDFSKDTFPFFSYAPSPFNSQNTFFTRKALRDFYCFPFIGRMDDIWGAYYCLSQGHKVVYSAPTVYQARNEHDLIVDFSKEVIGYENTHRLVREPHAIQKYIPERSWNSFVEYQRLINVCDVLTS